MILLKCPSAMLLSSLKWGMFGSLVRLLWRAPNVAYSALYPLI